jgi:hypothetical protein
MRTAALSNVTKEENLPVPLIMPFLTRPGIFNPFVLQRLNCYTIWEWNRIRAVCGTTFAAMPTCIMATYTISDSTTTSFEG